MKGKVIRWTALGMGLLLGGLGLGACGPLGLVAAGLAGIFAVNNLNTM